MKKTLLALALAAGLAGFAGTAKADIVNLVTDGDFSAGVGGNFGPAWTTSGDYLTVARGDFNAASLGGQSVNSDTISQNISSLVVGNTYNFAFAYYLAPNLESSWGSDNNLSVSIGSQLLFSESNQVTDWYVGATGSFVAESSTMALTIIGDNPSNYNYITDIVIASVPEPSQVAASLLLVSGIAGFVIVRRKALIA
jgi:hypothetical protein